MLFCHAAIVSVLRLLLWLLQDVSLSFGQRCCEAMRYQLCVFWLLW
jgi:hypothetical protein